MTEQPRIPMATLRARALPSLPGVYSLWRDDEAIYVGKAKSLTQRLGGAHRGRGTSMTNSALRRNVAELLGIATSADIKALRYRPTSRDAARVVAWLDGCDVAWIRCETEKDALHLERDLKREWQPRLTKR